MQILVAFTANIVCVIVCVKLKGGTTIEGARSDICHAVREGYIFQAIAIVKGIFTDSFALAVIFKLNAYKLWII